MLPTHASPLATLAAIWTRKKSSARPVRRATSAATDTANSDSSTAQDHAG